MNHSGRLTRAVRSSYYCGLAWHVTWLRSLDTVNTDLIPQHEHHTASVMCHSVIVSCQLQDRSAHRYRLQQTRADMDDERMTSFTTTHLTKRSMLTDTSRLHKYSLFWCVFMCVHVCPFVFIFVTWNSMCQWINMCSVCERVSVWSLLSCFSVLSAIVCLCVCTYR